MSERAQILLRAARDLLRKCEDGRYEMEPMSTTVAYDGTNCDGYCLAEDIENELGLEPEDDVL